MADSCVRGHHISTDVWTPSIGEELSCQCEENNLSDLYVLAVKNDASTVVGHVPRMVSVVCSLFLHRGGTIVCQVTGSRRASVDLPQGGLEVPCTLKFAGEKKLLMPSACPDSTGPTKAKHTGSLLM